MKSICVYCGSAHLATRKYFDSARSMGAILARRGLTLIYGGGKTGLMGAVADGVLENGGRVIGVIVKSMNTPELAHTGLNSLEVTNTIHQRKARMYELADGYVALPGGYGTLDELFETLTWAQIGEHAKPVGILNVDGYYDPLLAMLDRAVAEKFLFAEHRRALLCDSDPETLLDAMLAFRPSKEAVERWMRQD
jgi:uncharacterized protein (TIGR00730 family)